MSLIVPDVPPHTSLPFFWYFRRHTRRFLCRSVTPRPSVGSRSLGWVLCGPMCKSADLEGGLSNPAKAASNRRRTSEISRCAPSDMFFYEIVPTLVTANKRRLEPTDIEIDHDTAVDQYELFAESWRNEQVMHTHTHTRGGPDR